MDGKERLALLALSVFPLALAKGSLLADFSVPASDRAILFLVSVLLPLSSFLSSRLTFCLLLPCVSGKF